MIPLMGVCYMMRYIDKLALSQAALLNLRKDLNLQGNQYSWTSAIFYFGYLVWSWPSSYLIVRLPLGKYFSAIIINGFGYSKLQSFLMQMPVGGAQIVFLTISTVVTSFTPSTRIVMMVINCAASMVGMILIWKLDQDQLAGQMVGITLGAVFGVNIPLSLSLISSNVAGFTKRSVTSALLFIAYCVGNITGIKAAMSGLVLGMGFLLGLMGYYTWVNHRRNRIHGRPEDITESEELAQDLSNRTDREIPSFRYVL
ncbi:Allantoate [Aspergillus sp. HF37]|nr:Allantoate [Aspergillus sp. HF37]